MVPEMSEFYWFKSKTISRVFAQIIARSPLCYKLVKQFKSIIKIYKLTLLEL